MKQRFMEDFRRFRTLLLSLALCAAFSPAPQAQEQDSPATPVNGPPPFPLLSIIAASRRGSLDWQPDWPVSLPPDAFTPNGAANGSATGDADRPLVIVLGTEEGDYTLRRDGRGGLREFPFPFDESEGGPPQGRRLYQVSFLGAPTGDANDDAGYTGFTVTLPGPAGDPSPVPLWTVEFLRFTYDGDAPLPVLCRLSGGGVWYFAALEYRGRRASETWFDAAGVALGIFNYTGEEGAAEFDTARLRLQTWTAFAPSPGTAALPPAASSAAGQPGAGQFPASGPGAVPLPAESRYFYDSFGNVAELKTPAGNYSARYRRKNRPRYWHRPLPQAFSPIAISPGGAFTALAADYPAGAETPRPAFFSFQWDERGLLVRLSGQSEDGGFLQDSRYEYILDRWGNWTERRETIYIRSAGYLVPAAERRVTRRIEYQGDYE
jgi:hypothetical protein